MARLFLGLSIAIAGFRIAAAKAMVAFTGFEIDTPWLSPLDSGITVVSVLVGFFGTFKSTPEIRQVIGQG